MTQDTHFLLPGEQVLWRGRPDPRWDAQGSYLGCVGIPFAIVGLGGLMIAGHAVASAKLPFSTRLMALAAGLVPLTLLATGLFLLTMPARKRAELAKSEYVLTDRRLLTFITGVRRKVASVDAANIGPLHLTADDFGKGSIVVETHSRRLDNSRITQTFAWQGIEQAAEVHRMIAALKAAGGQGEPA